MLFRRVELFADERENILGELDELRMGCWTLGGMRWMTILMLYDDIYTDAEARSPKLVQIDDDVREHPGVWKVQQTFADPGGTTSTGIRRR